MCALAGLLSQLLSSDHAALFFSRLIPNITKKPVELGLQYLHRMSNGTRFKAWISHVVHLPLCVARSTHRTLTWAMLMRDRAQVVISATGIRCEEYTTREYIYSYCSSAWLFLDPFPYRELLTD